MLAPNVDISAVTVTSFETLYVDISGGASMTGAQLLGFSHVSASIYYSGPGIIKLTTGGSIVYAGAADTAIVFNLAGTATSIDLSGMTAGSI